MALLIPGPTAPSKDMDVFLRPLADELKELWEQEVETIDAVNGSSFCMPATLVDNK